MARIFTEGAEKKDMSFFDVYYNCRVGTAPRSGYYSYYFNRYEEGVRSLPSLSELYYRFAIRLRNNFWTIPRSLIAFTASDHVNQHIVGLRLVGGRLKVRLGGNRDGSGSTEYDTDNFVMIKDVYYLIELYLKIDSTNGRVIVKLDGVVIFDYTGNTLFHSATAATRLYHSTGHEDIDIDDLALNDTTGTEDNAWCGDGRVIPLLPNGAGDSTQLSVYGATSNYQAVDEGMNGNGDTDYVYGNTVGYKDLYNIGNLNIPDGSEIKRVWVTAAARNTTASGGKIALGIKSGTTEDWSNDITLGLNYANYDGKIYTKNPATNNAWTKNDIDNLQIGVKITEVGS